MPIALSRSCQTCKFFSIRTASFGVCSSNYNLRVRPYYYCELYEPEDDLTWSKTWLQKNCGPNPRLRGWQQSLRRAIKHATEVKRNEVISQRTITQTELLLEWEKGHPAPKRQFDTRPDKPIQSSPRWLRWHEARRQVERNFPAIPEDFTNTLRIYLKQFRAEYIKNNPPPVFELTLQQDSTTRFEEAISDD